MDVLKSGISALGKLALVFALAVTFLVGMLSVVYLQLKGEEVTIPKIVGKNFNDGREDLAGYGLRIKRIASRYSNETPDTILEQRPRAGSTAKSGLMISVVVSERSPDGFEAPMDVRDDEEAIKEIEEQPELKIDKPKPKNKPKISNPKTRDVMTTDTEDTDSTSTSPADGAVKESEGSDPSKKPAEAKPPVSTPKPSPNKPPGVEKRDTGKPKPNGETRDRRATEGN